MSSKARGGLSKREFAAKSGSTPVSYGSGGKKSSGKSFEKQLKSAQKAYEKTLMPSKDEIAAEDAVNKEAQTLKLTTNKITNEPIARGFQTGQIREEERRTEEKMMPLKFQVATLRARREAAQNVAASKQKFVMDSYERKQAKAPTKSVDIETQELQKEKLRAQVAKLKAPKKTGGSSSAGKWTVIDKEKGPTGRVRSILERNSKTGETRRTKV